MEKSFATMQNISAWPTFPCKLERTIVVDSFSKTYAMTGFRVGYASAAGADSAMLEAHQCSVACVDGAAQYAAIAALQGSQDFVRTMMTEFARRRKLLYPRINEIEGLRCALPKSAFYVFADMHRLERGSTDFSDYLLDEGRVAAVPSCAFGKAGEGYVRLSYATAYEKIEEVMDRIEEVWKNCSAL